MIECSLELDTTAMIYSTCSSVILGVFKMETGTLTPSASMTPQALNSSFSLSLSMISSDFSIIASGIITFTIGLFSGPPQGFDG